MTGVIAERDGCAVSSADAAVRGKNEEFLPPIAAGSHPIPAFCDHPNKSPDGRSRSISGVKGSDPAGPGTRVRMSVRDGSSESNGLVVTHGS